jgi:glucose/mannose transport system permease protein
VEITFEPWVKAWAEACTGLNCDGLSRGFWNSVQITVPSVVAVHRHRLGQRLCAGQLAFQGSEVFFTILIFGPSSPIR